MKNIFLQSPPFSDYAVIQYKSKGDLSNLSEWIVNRFDVQTWLITKKKINIFEIEDYKFVFSGYVIRDGILEKGALLKNHISNIENQLGMFSAFTFSNGKLKFFTDLFGQCIHFYYDCNDFILVSNRVHFLVEILRDLSIRRELDIYVLFRGLYYWGFFLNSYASSERLILKGGKQVEVGHVLTVENGRPNLEKVSYYLGCTSPIGTYEEYLAEAVEEQRNYYYAILSCNGIFRAVFDISGGKDSRLVLSGALADKKIKDKIEVITYKTSHKLDYEIGVSIQDYFGLCPTVDDTFHPRIPVRLQDAFDISRSFYMGTYFLFSTIFSANSNSSFGQNTSDVRFTGITSNVLRSGSTNTIAHYLPEIDSYTTSDLTDVIHNKFRFARGLPKKIDLDMHEFLKETFIALPGDEAEEILENMHLYYAARYHGGLTSSLQSWKNCLTFNPILTKSLYLASRKLKFSERTKGRIFYDFVVRTCPDLLKFPYDKPFPYADKMLENNNINKFFIDKSYDTSHHEIAVEQLKRNNKNTFLTEIANGFSPDDLKQLIYNKSFEALNKLYEHSSEISLLMGDGFKKHLHFLFEKQPEKAIRYAAMLFSASDIVC